MLRSNRFATWILAVGVTLATACGSGVDRVDSVQPSQENSRVTSLSGTWEGSLNCDTGENIPSVLKVADTGNPVFEYATEGGSREVELTYQGQNIRFVPPDGGIVNVVVDSLSVSPNRISYTLVMSGERTSEYGSSATLSQNQAVVFYDAALSGTELDAQAKIQSQTTLSQVENDPVQGGNQAICRGKLRK